MREYNIAVIAGDGIGQEVVSATLKVLHVAGKHFDFRIAPIELTWGCDYYVKTGRMMPVDGLKQLESAHAILLGAVGNPALVPDHISLRELLLEIRQGFGQFINMRPHRLLSGVAGPLRVGQFDMLCIRENSEGEYAGAGGRIHLGTPNEVAVETAIFTRLGCERVMRFAFEQARLRSGRVAAATKSNAMRHSMVFWDDVFAAVAAEYPDVVAVKYHVDALAARMITHPHTLDVIVASNLFGDILTDIGAAIQGGLGFAASANINPTGRYPSMFEPVHGSAPDIAGRGVANPSACIWSGAMMLDYLGEREAAVHIMGALERVTASSLACTPDMGGSGTTQEMALAVAAQIGRQTS